MSLTLLLSFVTFQGLQPPPCPPPPASWWRVFALGGGSCGCWVSGSDRRRLEEIHREWMACPKRSFQPVWPPMLGPTLGLESMEQKERGRLNAFWGVCFLGRAPAPGSVQACLGGNAPFLGCTPPGLPRR